jgi:hypothetical protein
MYDTRDDIKRIAIELRNKHDAMDWGVKVDDLIKLEGLTYDEYDLSEEGFINTLKGYVHGVFRKIKALLSVPNQLILIDQNLHTSKKPFGQGHELGHNTIPWHQEILYVCNEWDLSFETRKEMEFEANIFSAETLIPTPLLEKIYQEYPLSMETILHISQLSGASIQTSAIKYVFENPDACCLLTFKKERNEENGDICLRLEKCPQYSSEWYDQKIAFITKDQILNSDHVVTKFANDRFANPIERRECRLGEKTYPMDLFSNTYNVFALIKTLKE